MKYAALLGEVNAAATSPRAVTAAAHGLSQEQAAALHAPGNKSAIVIAGAGAGKTRLLVERVIALLQGGADPKRMAVVTFTRKAAQEMSERLLKRLGDKKKLPTCSTVHSLALTTLLRRKEEFALANSEQESACLEELEEFLPEEFMGLSRSEILLLVHRTREESSYSSVAGLVAMAYEERLAARGLDDFTTLLTRGSRRVDGLYDHVLVDESQDLSRLQLQFLRAVGPAARFWFIGDPDQSIYSFRGAQASMMHRLRDESELQFTLATNYRSARSIVRHANNVISNNPDRFPVVWKTARSDEGSVSVEFHEHGVLETQSAAQWLHDAPQKRCVLARTQALIAPLRELGLRALTVHESKGLEWDEVKVIGCEAALFPHPLAAREEERRLFYVAMTRARDTLVLSCAASRSIQTATQRKRSPSAFLFETQALQAKT